MNLQRISGQNVPAGIFSGTEAFWFEGEKWVIAHGTTKRFDECDSSTQDPIWRAFNSDEISLAYLAKIGVTKPSEIFDRWYQCVVGGLDHVPDFVNGKLTPDAYNNMCHDTQCAHRGRLCSRASGLKNIEVETITALKSARNMEQAAKAIHISLPAIKSRIAIMHEKFNVTNSVAMMARAAELGI